MNNLIDDLKSHKYSVNKTDYKIISDFSLDFDIKEKCVFGNLLDLCGSGGDMTYHFRKNKIGDIFISEDLFSFFREQHGILNHFFSHRFLIYQRDIYMNYEIKINESIEKYRLLFETYNYLKPSQDGGYLVYGKKGKDKIKIGRFLNILFVIVF